MKVMKRKQKQNMLRNQIRYNFVWFGKRYICFLLKHKQYSYEESCVFYAFISLHE